MSVALMHIAVARPVTSMHVEVHVMTRRLKVSKRQGHVKIITAPVAPNHNCPPQDEAPLCSYGWCEGVSTSQTCYDGCAP